MVDCLGDPAVFKAECGAAAEEMLLMCCGSDVDVSYKINGKINAKTSDMARMLLRLEHPWHLFSTGVVCLLAPSMLRFPMISGD